eukprot:scaffold4557_cov142-Amphora_coffeaeformis.AAC.4
MDSVSAMRKGLYRSEVNPWLWVQTMLVRNSATRKTKAIRMPREAMKQPSGEEEPRKNAVSVFIVPLQNYDQVVGFLPWDFTEDFGLLHHCLTYKCWHAKADTNNRHQNREF